LAIFPLAISTSELVTVTVQAKDFVHVNRLFQNNSNVRVVELSTDDNWWRDFGPCFVVNRTTKEVRFIVSLKISNELFSYNKQLKLFAILLEEYILHSITGEREVQITRGIVLLDGSS
jgi:hypothetical protein